MNSRLAIALGLLTGLLAPAAARASGPVVPAGHPSPAPTPARSGAADDDDEDSPSAPAATGPVKPAGAPAAAAPPGALSGKDAGASPSKETAAPAELVPLTSKQLENAIEAVYHQKTTDHVFTLHVRPASPKPGQMMELELEVVRLLDPPDPVLGDRQPEDAELVAVVTRSPHAGPRVVHPLKDPGDYGLHVTAGETGIATVAFGRRSGKPGLDIKFPIGIGVPTPARPDDVTLRGTEGRSPVNAREGGDELGHLMRQIEQETYGLDTALADPRAGDAAASAKALAGLASKVAGNVPADHTQRRQEFDQLGTAFASSAAALAGRLSDREKARSALAQLELDSCTRCHAQFMWDVADDTANWPGFTPATPPSPTPATDPESP